MNKYDAIYEELQNKVNIGELTQEDASILNDIAYEKYADVYLSERDLLIEEASSYLLDCDMTLEEVCDIFEITEKTMSNAVMVQTIVRDKVSLFKKIKVIKKEIRKKKYDDAEKHINELRTDLLEVRKMISEIETSSVQDSITQVSKFFAIASTIFAAVDTLNLFVDDTIKSQCDSVILQNGEEIIPDCDRTKAYKIAGYSGAAVATGVALVADTASKKYHGKETNQIKSAMVKANDKALEKCEHMKNRLRRKKKFDEFMKKYNKQIKVGAVAAGTVGAGLVAKKILSNRPKVEKPKR